MSAVETAFAEAQEKALRLSVQLAAAMGLDKPRIYDARPEGASYPYIVRGEDQFISDGDECQDGSEVVSTLHLWSRTEPRGSAQARAMLGVLRELLNADLGLAGHETVLHEFVDARVLTEPGGVSHGVAVFRYLTTPI